MSKPSLQNITTSNTFQVWFDRTNDIVDIMKDEVITASVLGDTTGSEGTPLIANLIGQFTANTVLVSDTLRADEISPLPGSTEISINNPIIVDTPVQIAVTLSASAGPRLAFDSDSVSWRTGFDNIANNDFIIDTGAGVAKFRLTPGGDIDVPGEITSATGFIGELTGNAATATQFFTARTIGMTGDVVWTTPDFDGTQNVTAAATIQDGVISNAKFRDSSALAVVGRASNSAGDVADIQAADDHQVLRRNGTSLGFGAVALNQSNAVTGTLPVGNGGTGATSFISGRILIGNETSAISTSANLIWDSPNNRLGVGIPLPEYAVDVNGDVRANIFRGTATSAQYADLAEKYLADKTYEPGTVVCVGGDAEVTATAYEDRAIGVVSTQPALMMNSGLEGGTYIALKGRVPVKVKGTVNKGDALIPSYEPGVAMAGDKSDFNVFAIALSESKDGMAEAVIL